MKGNVQVLLPTTAVDDGCCPDHGGTCGTRDVDRLASGASGRNDVLDDEHALSGLQ
jgi:hypothetical protein